MDYVNFQVAIGGDVGNTVPKFFIPVSEVPVLLAIHGADSLFDFEQVDPPAGTEELSNHEELQRLNSIYGRVADTDGNTMMRLVYPGAGAKVVTSIDALDIPEGAFKAIERATPKKGAASKKTAAKKEPDPVVPAKPSVPPVSTEKAPPEPKSDAKKDDKSVLE